MGVEVPITAGSAQASGDLVREVWPWLGLLVLVVIAGGIVVMLVRRFMYAPSQPSPEGFTLHDLREMRAAGEISEEEFQAARAAMIGRMTAAPETAGIDGQNGDEPGPSRDAEQS